MCRNTHETPQTPREFEFFYAVAEIVRESMLGSGLVRASAKSPTKVTAQNESDQTKTSNAFSGIRAIALSHSGVFAPSSS